MDALDELKKWLGRDLASAAARKGWTIESRQDSPTVFICQIASPSYEYTITANTALDYLDCICRTRRNAPGTNHPLFKDLPDGKLSEQTWRAIVSEIKRMELRPFRGRAL